MTVDEQFDRMLLDRLDDLKADLRDEIRTVVEDLEAKIERLEERLNDHDDDDHALTRSAQSQDDYERDMGEGM